MKLLRSLPVLDARKIIDTTLKLIPLLQEDLYDLLARHTYDPTVCDILLNDEQATFERNEQDDLATILMNQ